MNATHTPTPWTVHPKAKTANEGSAGFVVAACGGHSDNRRDPEGLTAELEANAAFIVKACNAHDDLVAALKALADDHEFGAVGEVRQDHLAAARAALAKAGA